MTKAQALQFQKFYPALQTYEGHPINKLQNGIILLIFKTWKIQDIRFVAMEYNSEYQGVSFMLSFCEL